MDPMKQWRLSKPSWTPRPAQQRGLDLLFNSPSARLFLKPGAGKTATVLEAFRRLKAAGEVDTLLVLAPLRVCYTSWPQELSKWEQFDGLTYSIIHGGPDKRQAAMKVPADVYLMNCEGLLTDEWRPLKVGDKAMRAPPIAAQWLAKQRVMLVVDESTKFKDSSTRRFKALKHYLSNFPRRVILTGTPRPGTLEDLFAQCFITDDGADLGKFVTHFRLHYMRPHYSGYGWEEQPGAAEAVATKIAPTTLQVRAEEEVPILLNEVWVPMPEKLRSQYDTLAKELLVELTNGRTILAPNAGVLFGKLRQFAQGAVFGTDKLWTELHGAKLDALENILEELNGEPAFCLYHYSHDYERISARLKSPIPRIGGGVGANEGRVLSQQFSQGLLPLLLGHPQSVGLGVDGLQDNCRNVIWFANSPSYEQTYQANLRIARPGQRAESVTIHHIMLDCSIERAILALVTNKEMREADFVDLLTQTL